jgi:hypothetical protein
MRSVTRKGDSAHITLCAANGGALIGIGASPEWGAGLTLNHADERFGVRARVDTEGNAELSIHDANGTTIWQAPPS